MNMTIFTAIAVLFVAAGKADKFKTNWMGMNVEYSLINDEWIHKGDMIIGDEQHGVYNASDGWPDGIIPYEMDDDLLDIFNETILNEWNTAIHDIHSKTSIIFTPRTSQSDYLWIYYGNGCNSRVGFERGSGKHLLSLTKDCSNTNAIIHQLEHVAGLHDQVCGKKIPSKQGCRGLSVSDVDCINNHLYQFLFRPPLLLKGLSLISKNDEEDGKVTFSSVGYKDIKIVYKIQIQTLNVNPWLTLYYSCSNNMKYKKLVQYTQMRCPKIEISDLSSDCDNSEKVVLYFQSDRATLSDFEIYGVEAHSTIRRLQSSSSSSSSSGSSSSSSSSSDEEGTTMNPTFDPTDNPSFHPTIDPTINPTFDPTANPSAIPTENPTSNPTLNPAPAPPVSCGTECTDCSDSEDNCIADDNCKWVGAGAEDPARACTVDCNLPAQFDCAVQICQDNAVICDADPRCAWIVTVPGCFGP